jgi:ankyrin repeat protein
MQRRWQRQYSSYVNAEYGAACDLLGHGWHLLKFIMSSTLSQFDMIDIIWDNRATELKNALQSGLDVNAVTDDTTCSTLLMMACMGSHTELVNILLNYKADVRKTNCDDDIALHGASYISRSKVIRLLIQADPETVNFRNKIGQTPLMVAAKRCYPRVVKLLLEAGSDRKAVDHTGNTVLHWCFTERHKVTDVNATIKLLFHDESEFDIQNERGRTPRDYLKSFQNRYPEYALVTPRPNPLS